MTITIKDEQLDRAVRALAESLGESLVGAIRVAGEHEQARVERQRSTDDLEAALDELVVAAAQDRIPGAATDLDCDQFGEPA